MKISTFQGAALVAFLLAVVITVRITLEHASFQKTVRQSLSTSEGYDQKFIDLVNHLEDVLTTRATFSYPGGRDPMTGRQREVAQAPLPENRPTPRRIATTSPTKPTSAATTTPTAPTTPTEAPDPFRLTALIADDFGRYTAIVMDGERSMSVDVGDAVAGKKVARISAKEIVLESAASLHTYGLNGSRTVTPK